MTTIYPRNTSQATFNRILEAANKPSANLQDLEAAAVNYKSVIRAIFDELKLDWYSVSDQDKKNLAQTIWQACSNPTKISKSIVSDEFELNDKDDNKRYFRVVQKEVRKRYHEGTVIPAYYESHPLTPLPTWRFYVFQYDRSRNIDQFDYQIQNVKDEWPYRWALNLIYYKKDISSEPKLFSHGHVTERNTPNIHMNQLFPPDGEPWD